MQSVVNKSVLLLMQIPYSTYLSTSILPYTPWSLGSQFASDASCKLTYCKTGQNITACWAVPNILLDLWHTYQQVQSCIEKDCTICYQCSNSLNILTAIFLNLGVSLLVVTIWLELCTSHSSSCYHHFQLSLAPIKPANPGSPGKMAVKWRDSFKL